MVLASAGHRYADVDLDDPGFDRTDYDPVAAYGRSKTANILFAVEFDRRHRDRGVRGAAVHPGGIQTDLTRHIDPGRLEGMVAQINRDLADQGAGPFELKTVPQGAATSVWAAARAEADEIGGRYCESCHVSRVVPDDWKITPVSEGVRAYAVDPSAPMRCGSRARRWWASVLASDGFGASPVHSCRSSGCRVFGRRLAAAKGAARTSVRAQRGRGTSTRPQLVPWPANAFTV